MHRMTLRLMIAIGALVTAINGQAADTNQWIQAANADVRLWNPAPVANESVEWLGAEHEATGAGIVIWRVDGVKTEQAAGEWEAGKLEGYGVWQHRNGDRYEGQWENGRKHGFGVYTWADGKRFCGLYRGGNRQAGVFYHADGKSAGERMPSATARQHAFEAEAAAIRARQAAGDARHQAIRVSP